MPWLGREGETCGQGCELKGGSRGYNHGIRRVRRWRERGNRNFGDGTRQSERQAEKREKREQCWGIEGEVGGEQRKTKDQRRGL